MQASDEQAFSNLNKISEQAAFGLIRKVLACGVNLKRVYVDTVGNPDKYRQKFEYEFKGQEIKFTVESKADDTYPVVSAASICAKVTRDHELEQWQYKENYEPDRQPDKDFDCGYPSHPKTKAWLKRHFDEVFAFPQLVRFSW